MYMFMCMVKIKSHIMIYFYDISPDERLMRIDDDTRASFTRSRLLPEMEHIMDQQSAKKNKHDKFLLVQ